MDQPHTLDIIEDDSPVMLADQTGEPLINDRTGEPLINDKDDDHAGE